MFTDETTLLSSLLTDPRMREALRSSSQTFITKHALNDSLSAFVLSLDLDQLDKQAECLIQKRFSEVKMLLPRTIAQLGKEAWCRFSEYATRYRPRGHRRHLLDAVQFGNYNRMTVVNGHAFNFYSVVIAFLCNGLNWIRPGTTPC